NHTASTFVTLNAVLSGVKDIRTEKAAARQRLDLHRQRTILFVDEVHRFNKSQQDALLPHVENGTVVFIGATTENPYFEVNKALVSRSRVFEMKSLTPVDLDRVVDMTLSSERGYADRTVDVRADARRHLVSTANGDARSLLNALELAIETTEANEDGVIVVDLAVAEDSIQRRAVLYDKEGDAHFDTISAFIKSMRGADVDAALYWLTMMVYAGEDPRFIFRRMIIFAAEDVGLADPRAIQVAMACSQAFEFVGMPEGQFHLGECCIYLATAPKSNSTFAYFDALKHVTDEQTGEVPNPLKDGNRDAKGLGHGKGYLYPHAYHNHYVPQQYLPDSMQGTYFYEPTAIGYEKLISERLAYWRSRDEKESVAKRAKRYADEDEDASQNPKPEG
ncbi:MAG: AAA family ATPase, partial [Rhodothermales bacterium]|nr:AAA family ATPase [Rhodothermales bacterium]